MKCWACQSKMLCSDSRPLYEGRQRYRRYVCPNCGEQTRTLEKILSLDEYFKLPDLWPKRKKRTGV